MALTLSEVSNYIPDDIAFKILSKLPVKSLKRFSCLCKSFSNLFENPQFMSMYRKDFLFKDDNQNSQLILKQSMPPREYDDNDNLYLLSGETFENSVKLDWPPPFESHADIFIAGPVVNGILCLYQGNGDEHWIELKVLLWNPATGEFKVIPPGFFVCPVFKVIPPSSAHGAPLIIETCVRLHGFGYDLMTDDYKLIRHVSYPDGVEEDDTTVSTLWEIYSLRSNCWRKLSVEMPNQLCLWRVRDIDFVLYLNGLCHWMGYEDFNVNEGVLVSFNLSDEYFIITPMNHCDDSCSYFDERCLVELKGSIAMISIYGDTPCFDISILGELGVAESWTKVFSIGPLPFVYFKPIGVGKKGNIFFANNLDELARFDVNTEMIEEIGVQGDDRHSQIVIYNESLLPIGGINL